MTKTPYFRVGGLLAELAQDLAFVENHADACGGLEDTFYEGLAEKFENELREWENWSGTLTTENILAALSAVAYEARSEFEEC